MRIRLHQFRCNFAKYTSEGKGGKVLRACIEKFARVNEILLKDIPKEDLRFLIELLQPIDEKFPVLWKEHRSKEFAEVYAEITGRKEIDEFKNH